MHVTLTTKTLVCVAAHIRITPTPPLAHAGGLTVILPSNTASNRRTESTDHITDHYVPY
jgi:hypothetical protein